MLMDSKDFLHAHHHSRPHIAAVRGDDVEIDPVVGRVGMIRRQSMSTPAARATGPTRPMFLHQRLVGDANATRTLLDVLVLAHRGDDRASIRLPACRAPVAVRPSRIGRDVAAHAADNAQRVGLAVAADLLGDPHDGLADAEALHEQRVEADDVAGQPDPQQVAVQALDLQHDGADVFGAGRDLERGRGSRRPERRPRCARSRRCRRCARPSWECRCS